jgi:excisionase family DNA binding protein
LNSAANWQNCPTIWWEVGMFSFNTQVDSSGIVLYKHISVKAAAEFSGYNIQYLRRLLRTGQLEGIKIGQVWLIKMASLDAYLKSAQRMGDRRCGPRASLEEQTNGFDDGLFTGVNMPCQQM